MNKVIFKFDDYRSATPRVRKIDRFVRLFGVKITWGIIGCEAEKWTAKEVGWVKAAVNSGLYYFWNHGWTHSHREFEGLTKEEAVVHLQNTQKVVYGKLGIRLETFGAPCNALNDLTGEAVESVSDLKYWYYGREDFSGKNYCRELELEYPLFHPSFVSFVKSFRRVKRPGAIYVVQGHPDYWDLRCRVNFYLIVLYLKFNGVGFAFPGE